LHYIDHFIFPAGVGCLLTVLFYYERNLVDNVYFHCYCGGWVSIQHIIAASFISFMRPLRLALLLSINQLIVRQIMRWPWTTKFVVLTAAVVGITSGIMDVAGSINGTPVYDKWWTGPFRTSQGREDVQECHGLQQWKKLWICWVWHGMKLWI